MDRTRMLVIRHADHDDGGRCSQHSCPGITALGRNQAAALAETLTGLDIDIVLASRAARTIQTARVVADAIGLPVDEPTCDLCEMHPGAAEGLTYAEMVERYGPNYSYVPGAEYFPDWLPRGVGGLHRIAANHRGRSVACFTHNAVVAATFMAFGRMPHAEVESIVVDNTAATEWVCSHDADDRRRGVWQLKRHNDTAHLRALR